MQICYTKSMNELIIKGRKPSRPRQRLRTIALLWASLRGFFSRADELAPQPLNFGADYAVPEVRPTYNPKRALSAYARFPWLYAAMLRRSSDLASLPLRLYRRTATGEELVFSHPFHDLMDCPFPGVTGRELRKQIVIDKDLTGTCYVFRNGSGTLTTIQRLHPFRTTINPDPFLGVGSYTYDGAGTATKLGADEVYQVAQPSWEDDPRGLYGTGAILPLDRSLHVTMAALDRTEEIAKRGRPDAIVSPDTADEEWDPDVVSLVKKKLDALLHKGGAMVLARKLSMELPTWSPRDLEFEKVLQSTQESILAVTGVPPHMLGLPTANYAMAEAQERAYYQGLMGEAQDFDDSLWTPLAKLVAGPEYIVRTDFSSIDVLAKGRDARLERIIKMVKDLGADPKAAASFEGLPGMPVGVIAPAVAAQEAPRSQTPAPQSDNVIAWDGWHNEKAEA